MAKTKTDLTWQEIEIGGVVTTPGNAAEYKTGDWRSSRPVWDRNRCVKCAVCYIFCPDAAINETEEGFFEADLYYCKGCGICAHECPTGSITMVEEEE
mgnify:FL=1